MPHNVHYSLVDSFHLSRRRPVCNFRSSDDRLAHVSWKVGFSLCSSHRRPVSVSARLMEGRFQSLLVSWKIGFSLCSSHGRSVSVSARLMEGRFQSLLVSWKIGFSLCSSHGRSVSASARLVKDRFSTSTRPYHCIVYSEFLSGTCFKWMPA